MFSSFKLITSFTNAATISRVFMRIFICLKQNVIYVCFSFCVMNVFVCVFVVCVCAISGSFMSW